MNVMAEFIKIDFSNIVEPVGGIRKTFSYIMAQSDIVMINL